MHSARPGCKGKNLSVFINDDLILIFLFLSSLEISYITSAIMGTTWGENCIAYMYMFILIYSFTEPCD